MITLQKNVVIVAVAALMSGNAFAFNIDVTPFRVAATEVQYDQNGNLISPSNQNDQNSVNPQMNPDSYDTQMGSNGVNNSTNTQVDPPNRVNNPSDVQMNHNNVNNPSDTQMEQNRINTNEQIIQGPDRTVTTPDVRINETVPAERQTIHSSEAIAPSDSQISIRTNETIKPSTRVIDNRTVHKINRTEDRNDKKVIRSRTNETIKPSTRVRDNGTVHKINRIEDRNDKKVIRYHHHNNGYRSAPYYRSNAAGYSPVVWKVQKRLSKLGYYHNGIDGVMGQGTINALRAFQSRNGLAPTGTINRPTLHMLGIHR